MRIDQLYGPGGLDLAHPSYNVLDQFVHADPDVPARGVQVQHFDAEGRQVEWRDCTPGEVAFFFPPDDQPHADAAAVSALATASVIERLVVASDPDSKAVGEALAAAAADDTPTA